MTEVIRSSKVSLKRYCNVEKRLKLFDLISDDITAEVKKLTNILLYSDKIQALPDKTITESINHPSAIVRQVIAKEASANARSIRNKLKKIKTNKEPKKYQAELLEKFENQAIDIDWKGNIQLDSRFFNIQPSEDSSFDFWISLKWKGVERFYIPLKLTKHMRSLLADDFELKPDTMKICRNGEIILVFKKEVEDRVEGEVLGLDVGRNKSFMTSRNETEYQTKQILNSLKLQKHGSKNKAKRVRRLKTLIDSLIKQNIDWDSIKAIVLENLTNMKRGKRWGNINHHWSHRYIQNRIKLLAERLGVQVKYVSGAFTSQTCSKCGHRHNENRLGEEFECLSCGYETDADFNASLNIRKRGLNDTHGLKRISI